MNQNLDKYLQHDVHVAHFIMHVNLCLRALVGIQAYSFTLQSVFVSPETLHIRKYSGRVSKSLNQEPLDSQRGLH